MVLENSGSKYPGLTKYIIATKINGTNSNILTTALELAVEFFNSSFNFFLSNKVFSMEEKTLMILPPVLFKIVKDDDKYLASSRLILLANLSRHSKKPSIELFPCLLTMLFMTKTV